MRLSARRRRTSSHDLTEEQERLVNLRVYFTFHFAPPQGDSIRTNIQLDFGDGTAVSYSNLSWTEEGIKHVYKAAGIVRVTALAENSLGYDATTLYLHVTGVQRALSRLDETSRPTGPLAECANQDLSCIFNALPPPKKKIEYVVVFSCSGAQV